MFNSTALEVAIGMALVYMVLSLFCTTINEAIAGIFSMRAKNLVDGIDSLFTQGKLAELKDKDGKVMRKAQSLVEAIYGHGLVQSLYRSEQLAQSALSRKLKNLPSYIPSGTFASALFDVLFSKTAAPATQDGDEQPTAEQAKATQLAAMVQSIEDSIPDGPAKQAIATLVKEAKGDADKTREALAKWYDDGMERAAGWYKRKTQFVSFIIGLILAVAVNVDSVRVAQALWTSPATRSYAVQAAGDYAQKHPLPANTDASTAASTQEKPDPTDDLKTLQSLNLPLGWDGFKPQLSNGWWIFQTLLGWLMTAIAMTLGAPFWFDLLSQFMVIRSTIKPDEKSQTEAS